MLSRSVILDNAKCNARWRVVAKYNDLSAKSAYIYFSAKNNESLKKFSCPACLKEFPRSSILKHTSKNPHCKKALGANERKKLKENLNQQFLEEKKQLQVERQRKCRENKTNLHRPAAEGLHTRKKNALLAPQR